MSCNRSAAAVSLSFVHSDAPGSCLEQIAAADESLDDAGACGLGADAGGVLEDLFQAGIADEFRDALRRLDQFALRVRAWRLRGECVELDLFDRAACTVRQRRQGLAARRLAIVAVTIVRCRFAQYAAPADHCDLIAGRVLP